MEFSLITLLSMVALFSVALGRAVYATKCAHVLNAREVIFIPTSATFVACLFLVPFFWDQLLIDFEIIKGNLFLPAVALFKGVLFFAGLSITHIVRRHSTSAIEYRKFILLGVVAVANYFMGEMLTPMQWASVAALSVLGVYYIFKGHIAEAPLKIKGLFLLSMVAAAGLAPGDHFYLSNAHWLSYMLMTTLSMSVTSLVMGARFKDFKLVTSHKFLWGLIGFGVFGEFVIMILFVTYIPVTIGVASMALAAPIFMAASAIIWKEGCWKQQMTVGVLSYIAALALIF